MKILGIVNVLFIFGPNFIMKIKSCSEYVAVTMYEGPKVLSLRSKFGKKANSNDSQSLMLRIPEEVIFK